MAGGGGEDVGAPVRSTRTVAASVDIHPKAIAVGSTSRLTPMPTRRPSSRQRAAAPVVARSRTSRRPGRGSARRHLVVDHPAREGVRQFVVADHVATAQLERIHAEAGGEAVDHLLAHDRLDHPRPAVAAPALGVGVHGLTRRRERVNRYGPGKSMAEKGGRAAPGQAKDPALSRKAAFAPRIVPSSSAASSRSPGPRASAGRP